MIDKTSLIRALRRRVPSVSRLTYLPPVRALLNLSDIPGRLLFPELRDLPPNHMRTRVGVGWRLLGNQVQFLSGPMNFWLYAVGKGFFRSTDTVVDIGVGCGRYARCMRDYLHSDDRFTGTYIGIDVDEEMLAWCRSHFAADRFRFHQSPHRATSYNRCAGSQGGYRIPEADGTVDFVFSTSLFTHLLEPELRNYLSESHRLLKPGRVMVATCFCLDYPPPTYGSRHLFGHRIGNAHVESLEQPEAAVAYTAEFLFAAAAEAGFSELSIQTSPLGWQPLLIGRKPA